MFIFVSMGVYDVNNKSLEVGYISKNKILKYVTEEQIFALVFGYEPKANTYTTSPFREDNSPGCFFSYATSGKLKFVDFSGNLKVKNRKLISIDCFDAVQIYFKFNNFYESLKYIYDRLIKGKEKEIIKQENSKPVEIKEKEPVSIYIDVRPFNKFDRLFWQPYGITKENLIEDQVFALEGFCIKNTKKGDFYNKLEDIGYAYTDFYNNKVKIYRPYQSKNSGRKFTTNCGSNDIGGYKTLKKVGERLIIAKSYKDYRVLKNLGYDVVWFQNEGMYPDNEYLEDLSNRFDELIIFFDNDEPGIEAAKKLKDLLNFLFTQNVKIIHLPKSLLKKKVKDPSDFRKKYGEDLLIKTIKQLLNEI